MGKLTKILIVLLSVSILFIVLLLLNRNIEKSTVIINPQTKERVFYVRYMLKINALRHEMTSRI
mgnify:CR=1 FL=1